MGIKILIADDHAVFRSGVKALLEKEPDFEVAAEAGTGGEAVDALAHHEIDVVTLDISMPGQSSTKVVKELLQIKPDLAIVVLTMHEDEFYMEDLFKAGVRAFVLKKSKSHALFDAIRSAHRGENYVDPLIAGRVLSPVSGKRRAKPVEERTAKLTQREREVCKMLALGHTNAEIADKLNISARTVETHRMNILSKLDLKSRADLVRFAIENEIIKLY